MSAATALAIVLVRAWTRLYTCGLPLDLRTARRAEIDSDLWELQHDSEGPQPGRAAPAILLRLMAGIPDDLAWRMEIGATGHAVPATALAAAGMMTGPRRVSALGLSATMHVIGISAVVWLTSHGFLYWRHPDAVVPQQAELWPQLETFEIGAEALAAPEQDAAPTQPNKFITTLLQNRYSLDVGKGYLLGPGAPVLQSAVRQSRFVLLGDDSDLPRISELGSAICSATLQACDSVLMKVDALQVYRGVNPARVRGIGSDFAIQAERQGLQSLHIRVVVDDGSAHPRALQLFLSRRLESHWTLFDLRPLRQNFNVLAGRGNIDLATLVFGIDLLVVVPEGTPSTQVR
jgi:hypothetical protein